jgi:hypothetical protein
MRVFFERQQQIKYNNIIDSTVAPLGHNLYFICSFKFSLAVAMRTLLPNCEGAHSVRLLTTMMCENMVHKVAVRYLESSRLWFDQIQTTVKLGFGRIRPAQL